MFIRAAPGDLVPDTKLTVKGLTEGKLYEFRVAAVNEAGPGPFAETSEAILTAPPPSKCCSLVEIYNLLLWYQTKTPHTITNTALR